MQKKKTTTKELTVKVLLKAVKAMCVSCSGGVQSEVERCSLRECPLYAYRKGQQTQATITTNRKRKAAA